MSIGPLPGLIPSVAGAPLAQAKGADAERTQQDTVSHDRQLQGELRSEAAAGIGAADGEEKAASERDADGRRLWEAPLGPAPKSDSPADEEPSRASRDATGARGQELDLSG
jgi:hypothetical protein